MWYNVFKQNKGGEKMLISKIKLETLLAKECMTYSDLSNKSRVSRITIQKVVNNKVEPRPATIGKIAKALGVTIQELIETDAATSNQFDKGSENKGFIETEETQAASEEFRLENNTVLKWIHDSEDVLDRLESEPIQNGLEGLYPEYVRYCESVGEKEKSQREFTTIICSEYGYISKQRRIPKPHKPGFRPYFFMKK